MDCRRRLRMILADQRGRERGRPGVETSIVAHDEYRRGYCFHLRPTQLIAQSWADGGSSYGARFVLCAARPVCNNKSRTVAASTPRFQNGLNLPMGCSAEYNRPDRLWPIVTCCSDPGLSASHPDSPPPLTRTSALLPTVTSSHRYQLPGRVLLAEGDAVGRRLYHRHRPPHVAS